MKPEVSVVIPVHNRLELTLRCLASLEPAAGRAEIIVVDDGSSDGTAEELSRRPELQLLSTADGPLGFSAAANLGLRHTRAEVLWLLNNDTEAPADAVDRLLAAFTASPRLGAAGAELCFPDGLPQWSAGRTPTLTWLFGVASGLPALLGRILKRRPGASPATADWVCGAAMGLRREAWEQVGPFDEGFRFYAQDLDLCLRLRQAGWGVALVQGLKVVHHGGATVGKGPNAAGGANPELLWTDLLRWAAKSQGPAWARKAGRLMQAGAGLRMAGRFAVRPFLPAAQRMAWDQETAAYRTALQAVRKS